MAPVRRPPERRRLGPGRTSPGGPKLERSRPGPGTTGRVPAGGDATVRPDHLSAAAQSLSVPPAAQVCRVRVAHWINVRHAHASSASFAEESSRLDLAVDRRHRSGTWKGMSRCRMFGRTGAQPHCNHRDLYCPGRTPQRQPSQSLYRRSSENRRAVESQCIGRKHVHWLSV